MKDIRPVLEDLASGYQYQKPPDFVVKLQELIHQFLSWLLEWFNALHVKSPQGADSRSLSGLLQIVVIVGGVVALLVLVWFVWSRIKGVAQQKASTMRGAAKIERILDAQGLKVQAEDEARRGEFKSACRSVYLSLLQLLHERDIAQFSPAKTNYEYLYLLNQHKELKAGFRDLADVVELVWFGTKDADGEDYQKCLKEIADLELKVETICGARKVPENTL